MPATTTRSTRSTNRMADPFRRVVVVIAPVDSIPECFLSAMEREFPWISIEWAEGVESACVEFEHPVSLILVDGAFLEETGTLADEIAERHPGVIVAAIYDDSSGRANIVENILATKPIRGVLPMNLRLDIWLSVLRLMLRGGEYFPLSFFQKEVSVEVGKEGRSRHPEDGVHRNLNGLTERERQVLEMVSHGCQNKLIAAKLDLSEHTIKVHIHHIIKKLGARNRTAAAAIFHDVSGLQNRDVSLSFGK